MSNIIKFPKIKRDPLIADEIRAVLDFETETESSLVDVIEYVYEHRAATIINIHTRLPHWIPNHESGYPCMDFYNGMTLMPRMDSIKRQDGVSAEDDAWGKLEERVRTFQVVRNINEARLGNPALYLHSLVSGIVTEMGYRLIESFISDDGSELTARVDQQFASHRRIFSLQVKR